MTAVNDAPRNLTAATAPGTINENETATVSGSFTDPDTGDTHTVTIVWSDGSANTVIALPAGVFAYSASHQYLDDNPTATASDVYVISVTVTDNGTPQGAGNGNTSITVNNVPPHRHKRERAGGSSADRELDDRHGDLHRSGNRRYAHVHIQLG